MTAYTPDRSARVDLVAVRAAGPVAIATALGFDVICGTTLAPCPSCRAPARSSRGIDKRGPVGLTRDGLGWRCHRCGAAGDAVTFAAFAACDTATPSDWRPVLELLERVGVGEAARPLVVSATSTEAKRPPRADVLELWTRCRPVVDDAACSEWLTSRGIDPWRVADDGLARALPANLSAPRWAWMRGGSWSATGYRCVLPLFDDSGTLTSLHARNLDRAAEPKGAMPAGYQVAGLVLTDAAGRQLLKHGQLAAALWIVEGAPDFLTAATAWGEAAEPPPAVLGILSGSWCERIAARVPNGARVILAVHEDTAGNGYIGKIVSTIGGRVSFWRWRATTEARP